VTGTQVNGKRTLQCKRGATI